MTQQPSPHALTALTTGTTVEDAAGLLEAAERALRKHAAAEYLALVQYLFAAARAEQPDLAPEQLTLAYLERTKRGRLLRQAANALAPIKGADPAQLRAQLVDAVNLYQHAPELLTKLHQGHVSLAKARAAAAKLKALRLPHPERKPGGGTWEPEELARSTEDIAASKTELGQALTSLVDRDLSDADFAEQAAAHLEEVHPEDAVQRHATALSRRHIRINGCPDGMGKLTLFDSAAKIQQIGNLLQGIAQRQSRGSRQAAEGGTHTADASPRTRAQLEADALTELLLPGSARSSDKATEQEGHRTVGAASATVSRPVTYIMTSLTEFLRLGGTASPQFQAFLREYDPELFKNRGTNAAPHGTTPAKPHRTRVLGSPLQPDAASLAALMLQSAILKIIVTAPVSGYPIGLGGSYRPPPVVRELVTLRDQHCRFPGCRAPASICELDHVRPFAESGQTAYANLVLLCREHHTGKTAGWWHITPCPELGDGVLRIRDGATGREQLSQPELPLAPDAWRAHRRDQEQADQPPF